MLFQAKKLKEVHRYIDDGPVDRPPVRLAFISDIHFPLMPVSGGEVVRRIAASDPDCVLIGGDLCQNAGGEQMALDFLRTLSAQIRVPILIVFGNHDILGVCNCREDEKKAFATRLAACGENIKVLVNERFVLKCAGTDREIVIGGLDDWRYGDRNRMTDCLKQWQSEATAEARELIILAHNPDVFTIMPEHCAAATLCGHTHGGQVYMPFNLEFVLLRKDIMPAKGFKHGLYRDEKKGALYITCGLGCSFLPIRFMTCAEIAYIYL